MALTDWQQAAEAGEQVIALIDQAQKSACSAVLFERTDDSITIEALFNGTPLEALNEQSPFVLNLEADSIAWQLLEQPDLQTLTTLWSGPQASLIAQLKHRLVLPCEPAGTVHWRFYSPTQLQRLPSRLIPDRLSAFLGPISAYGYYAQGQWQREVPSGQPLQTQSEFTLTPAERKLSVD